MTNKFVIFLEMIKFEHSIFALPFAYLGLLFAEEGLPRLSLFLWVTLAMVSFRTMGMGLNRLIDVQIDTANPRTKSRALPQGLLKPEFVWALTFISFVIFEFTAYKLGPLCFRLSPIPVFLAFLYPWTKRFTWLCHTVLGIILGIAPYGAWLASRPSFSWIPGFLTLGVTAWVAGFDIIYALQDIEFDRKNHLFSVPAAMGTSASLMLTHVLHAAALSAWFAAGWIAGAGIIYKAGLILVGLFLIRENWLVRSFGVAKVGEAFFTMNSIVSVSLLVFGAIDFSFRGVFS